MAWVIPVRGLPLIEGTSGAIFSKSSCGEVLMQINHNVSAKPAIVTSTTTPTTAVTAVAEGAGTAQDVSTLRWTVPTLTNFWMFLLRLHSTSVLGPLAISFQPRLLAPPLRPTPEAASGLDPFEMEMGGALDSEENKQQPRRWLRERLTEMDYIKVYHGATLSLNFRQLIEAYRDDEKTRELCSPRDRDRAEVEVEAMDKTKEERDNTNRRGKGNNKDRSKAWKPFKGVRLLLVDELGGPFLIA